MFVFSCGFGVKYDLSVLLTCSAILTTLDFIFFYSHYNIKNFTLNTVDNIFERAFVFQFMWVDVCLCVCKGHVSHQDASCSNEQNKAWRRETILLCLETLSVTLALSSEMLSLTSLT